MMSNPALWSWFAKDEAQALARENNGFAARLRDDHPGRFGVFAAIPLPDVDAALREIEYAFDTLKADGIGTTTNYGTTWPGDPAFDPVFDELNRRKAVVFIHPQSVACCRGLTPPVPNSTVEFMFDITRCIASLLYRGALTRFADIRFIFTHGGGTCHSSPSASRATRSTRKLLPKDCRAARWPNCSGCSSISPQRPAGLRWRVCVNSCRLGSGSTAPIIPSCCRKRPIAALPLTT